MYLFFGMVYFFKRNENCVLCASVQFFSDLWLYQMPDGNMHKMSEANIAENDVDFRDKVC